MKLKQMLICLILSSSNALLSGCISHSSPNVNLVLKGTFSDEVVTLDPLFLARQKKAEKNFFGTSSNPSSPHEENVDEEEELNSSDTKHSLNFNKDNPHPTRFGGIEIIWPTSGRLTSLFGVRTLRHITRMHAGIDIGAAKGTPIMAAADGQILFAGRKHGYGYSVIISHDNVHETLYAHMSKISVRVGQFVARNQLIGLVGKTGRVTGANLHFETRMHGVAYNPLAFLPPAQTGKVKTGMKTPTFAEQLDYYHNRGRVAYKYKNEKIYSN